MSESHYHIDLVYSLKKWINDQYQDNDSIVLLDLPDYDVNNKPFLISGYRPDAYAKIFNGKIIIIGEAKTARDLESKRSEKQLIAFLEFCSKTSNSKFVLAVPWDIKRFAISFIKDMKIQNGYNAVDAVVIDNIK